MESVSGLFSVRIVVADFYMHRPISGLDPTYSDYRGKEIKSVPVVRIFGSNPIGEKFCMHVHGVFPYFYIPYDQTVAPVVDQLTYQIAASLDKAINISLGQTQSQQQHVFKIQLVKGIPFYGYHRNEHQFLKVYLYNPRFIKKAANLFQNGAILGRVFQPHESHVPYVLQFLIDFNLYGMSFLHVPEEVVKYRQGDEFPLKSNLDKSQILDSKIARISTSQYEVDVAAAFILNRFQPSDEFAENANPGIEAIWQDERARRKNMPDEEDLPALEIPESQDRILARPTESDLFFKTALRTKLSLIANADSSMNSPLSSSDDMKSKFNLAKMLTNSVYPSECSQEMREFLPNASGIEESLLNSSRSYTTLRRRSKRDSNLSTDSSFVDEELVLSLSQPQQSQLSDTLREEDLQLLEVMQQLEDNEECIDLDSSLAPLSQVVKHSEECARENSMKLSGDHQLIYDRDDDDDDEDDPNDYTIAVGDAEEIISALSQNKLTSNDSNTEKLPQFDGADDSLSTPKKRRTTRAAIRARNSPRSPKVSSMSKYAPLDITIHKSPNVKINGILQNGVSGPKLKSSLSDSNLISKHCLQKAHVNLIDEFKSLTEMKTSTGELKHSIDRADSTCNKSKIPNNIVDEKSFITCNLKPLVTRSKSHLLFEIKQETAIEPLVTRSKTHLLFENNQEMTAEESNHVLVPRLKKCKVKLKRLRLKKEGSQTLAVVNKVVNPPESDSDVIVSDSGENVVQTKPFDSTDCLPIDPEPSSNAIDDDIANNNRADIDANGLPKSTIRAVEVFETRWARRRSFSPCEISREFDRKNNYFPKPGPSGIGKRKRKQYAQNSENLMRTRSKGGAGRKKTVTSSQEDTSPSVTPAVDSLPLFDYSPELIEAYQYAQIQSIVSQDCDAESVSIISKKFVLTKADVAKQMAIYNIPNNVYSDPFYGDQADVTSKREVGHTVLHIPGKSLNACEPFKSLVFDLQGVEAYRKDMLKSIFCGSDGDGNKNDDELQDIESRTAASIKEYFTSEERITITPNARPPGIAETEFWLQNLLETYESDAPKTTDESPIKVRQEKVKLILDGSIRLNGCDGDEHEDLSQKSISVSPLTPDSDKTRRTAANRSGNESTVKYKSTVRPLSALKKFKERGKTRARLSLTKRLQRESSTESSKSEANNHEASNTTDCSIEAGRMCSDEPKLDLRRTSFMKNLRNVERKNSSDVSFGLSGITLDDTFQFKISLQNLQNVKADIERTYLTVFSLEVHVNSRDNLKPNPEFDQIECVFFSITSDGFEHPDYGNRFSGCIIMSPVENPTWLNGVDMRIFRVQTELELIDELLKLCRHWDPDILAGYEIEMSSWGFVIDRAHVLGMNLKALLSRVPSQKTRDVPVEEDKDTYTDLDIEMKLCGRMLLDVWRLMRSEIALTSYSFENVMYHILHRRCPLHSFRDLTKWYRALSTRWIVLEYFLERVNGTLELLDQLDLLGRTSEMAKLIGIQFYEILSRGSQFRVESMMLRIAKLKNLVPLSPSVQQRAHSRAPEYLSLILEPKSRFYKDPIIVLDFQSLYPSIIIAYNYCFSTCLGRVEHLGMSTPFEFGCSQLRVSPTMLDKLLQDDMITISPCGAVFVKQDLREGVLPRMLKEILNTRLMVKQSMKIHKSNSTLQRVLHSRQLGLKLMANVTYGYTAANFSGRMPCVEVGDSVVSKGRETLERAIKLVEANKEWRAKVVYGDTDSLFVQVEGRSRHEAFKIGEEIAEAVTNDNPKPVKLKLEKVYHPCLLQTKKRYVGYMYESASQEKAVYDAKGIETVRRDGCPAVAKILEKTLRILFESCDVSEIKRYVCRQFTKLLTGNANVQDLIFAKEFRGKNGYKPGACVPALELTRKWLQTDPRNEPRRGQRVPFVIVNGPPGLPLIRLVRSPHEYIADDGLKINAIYYITKAIIPPLNRCLLLIGADVNDWFIDLPRKHLTLPTISLTSSDKGHHQRGDSKKSTISQYFNSTNCIIDCSRHTKNGICNECQRDAQKCTVVLSQKIAKLERSYFSTRMLCKSCCGRSNNIECQSLDCPVLFVSNVKSRDCKQVEHFRKIIVEKF